MAQEKVLVVEDEVIVARTISNQLTQMGYCVVGTASSGCVAIEKAVHSTPDLVLMDIMLKGNIDGITTASQIREHLDVPIVFLTAYADEQTVQRVKGTQPFGYLVKPYNPSELRVTIEMALLKHKLERELQDSREYLAKLLHSMSDAVVATDRQGRITFLNPRAEALSGWSQSEALGQNITEVLPLIHEITGLPVEHPINQAIQAPHAIQFPDLCALLNKQQQPIPIGGNLSLLQGSLGEMNGVVMVVWDMRDRRQSEFLQKALAKEKELHTLKSQFISTVSHEFRNPLAVIRTAAELLDLQGPNLPAAKMKTYLQRIKHAVRSMSQLMEDILFMGRFEAGRVGFNPEPIHLEEFCRELVEECSIDLSPLHQIMFNFQGDCLGAVMDETLLRHLLINLLNNAIKYSPQGGTILFNLIGHAKDQRVVFQIKDSGIGIPSEEQAKLFESFYRASNTAAIPGTGLGLTIAKRCVDLHQGTIHVTSHVGEGTTFTIVLPLQSG